MSIRTRAAWPAQPHLPLLKTTAPNVKVHPCCWKAAIRAGSPRAVKWQTCSQPPDDMQLWEPGVSLRAECALVHSNTSCRCKNGKRDSSGKILHTGDQGKDDILTFKWIKRCHEDVKEEPFQVGGVGRLSWRGKTSGSRDLTTWAKPDYSLWKQSLLSI